MDHGLQGALGCELEIHLRLRRLTIQDIDVGDIRLVVGEHAAEPEEYAGLIGDGREHGVHRHVRLYHALDSDAGAEPTEVLLPSFRRAHGGVWCTLAESTPFTRFLGGDLRTLWSFDATDLVGEAGRGGAPSSQ